MDENRLDENRLDENWAHDLRYVELVNIYKKLVIQDYNKDVELFIICEQKLNQRVAT